MSHDKDEVCYGEENAYDCVYDRTTGSPDDVYAEITANSTTGAISSFWRGVTVGFTIITVSCFCVTFFFIFNLRAEVTQLRDIGNKTQQDGDTIDTEPPSIIEEVFGRERSFASEDEKITTAIKQMTVADDELLSAITKMTNDFRELKTNIQLSLSKSSRKIDGDRCRMKNLLDLWAAPDDSLGALLHPEGWRKAFNGIYYKTSGDQTLSYADAKTECAKLGARLASKVLLYVGAKGVTLDYHWVGYDDLQTEGLWVWSDGTKTMYGEKIQWYPGQPDSGEGDEDCAMIVRLKDGKYTISDALCSIERLYVCEKDAPLANKKC